MTISLLTHGWVCYKTMTIIRRYVLPIQLQIESTQQIDLAIKNDIPVNLNVDNIIDKNLNLRLTEKNINIKKTGSTDINIDK